MAVSWNKALEINVPEIDSQHQELFRRYDSLAEALVRNEGAEAILGTLTFLAEYVVEHFRREEYLMQSKAYPGLDAHKKIHEAFLKEVTVLTEQLNQEGASDAFAATLRKKVFDWLWLHIGKEDRKIGEFLNKG